MKKKMHRLISVVLGVSLLLCGCGTSKTKPPEQSGDLPESPSTQVKEKLTAVTPTGQITALEDGLSAVRYEGDYGLEVFLERGGADTDAGVADFLTASLLSGVEGLSFQTGAFGCSTLSVPNLEGGALFGRNFDWEACDALIVSTAPNNGYASISTVNLDFLGTYRGALERLSGHALTLASVYAPLDGMNEKGLCVAVLMIQDSATINQDTGKDDLTTTTAVRMLLDQAADVEEALALLKQYDMHASMGMMVHFALSDADNRSVVVEYVGNEMAVTETPAATNFYFAEGEKQGVGTAQSHTRYDILMERLAQTPAMTAEEVRDAMDSVSKDNFGEFESTEWTVVYDQSRGELQYYHREQYGSGYLLTIG